MSTTGTSLGAAGRADQAGSVAHAAGYARLVERAVAIAAIALAAVVATFLVLTAVHRSTRRWVDHSRTVDRVAREALTLAIDRETGIRGYLLTRDTAALAPDAAARGPLRARLDSLVALTADNPAQQARARAARDALETWERDFADAALATPPTAPGAVATSAAPLAGKPLFDVVRERFREFMVAEGALYDARLRREAGAQRWAVLAVVAEVGLILAALRLLQRRLGHQGQALATQQEQLEEQAAELEHQTEEAHALARTLESANAALAASEERARLLVENVLDYAILGLDSTGRVMSWNAGAERIIGYTADEIIGRHVSVFYPPDEMGAGKVDHEIRVATAEGRFEAEGWRVRKDGSRFWANVVVTPLRDSSGALLGFAKVTRDLTAKRAAEEALRESEARFRAFVEAAPQLAWSAHADGTTAFFNARWYEYTGRSNAENGEDAWREVIHPDDLAHVAAKRNEAIAAGSPYEDELRLRRHDGAYRWFAARVVPVRDAHGTVVAWYGAALDVDDRHQAEEALREANRELATTTYTIAHDLRSPLRALDGYSRMLQLDYAERLGPEGRAQLDRIRANSQRMGALIDGILSLARIGRGELHVERVDLSAVARTAVDDLRRAEPDRVADVRIAPGVTATGDQRLLTLVVQNLLGNAWKFTRNNAAAGRRTEIEFGADWAPRDPARPRRGAQRVYYVRDNGVGFDPEFAGMLFGTFQRLHHADEFEGHGIGLATVKRVVERHGGTVWATGQEGAGATFYFTLGDGASKPPDGWSTAEPPAAAERAGVGTYPATVDSPET